MKSNPFFKIKTFFQNQIAKVIPSMTKENTTTDSHLWTRIWNQEFFQTLRKGILMGFGIMLGMFGTGVMAVAVTGIKTWSSNEKLTANDLNTTITSLKTAIESIPNWTKNGTSAYYNDGNVGIGTSSPGYPLTMNVTTSSHPFYLKNNTSSYYSGLILYNDQGHASIISQNGGNYSPWGGANTLNIGTVTNNNLNFLQNDTVRMTINSNGYVGIGTTSPTKTLNVQGTGIQIGQTTTNILTATDGNVSSYLESSIGYGTRLSSNHDISLSPGSSEKFRITSSGNVGIGTSSPSVSLHVAGNACTTGTGMTACASDRRLKQNIKPIENALDLILKVKPVHFTWNQLSEKEFGYKSGTQDIGVIAQEIEKINPDWVKTVKSDYKMVKDSFTKWYTIKAIQELNEIVEKENSALRSRYASLLDEHNSLKKEIKELSFRQSSMTDTLKTVNEENRELKKQLSILRKENSEKLSSLEERLKVMENLQLVRK